MKRTLLLTSLIGLSTFASAEVIEGVGTGTTAETAKQNAIDNAVKARVGEFLVSKEELNDEKINQKILSYSNVYTKSIETKSEEQKDGGYQVTVSIDVDSSKLIDKLKEAEPTIRFVAKTPEAKPENTASTATEEAKSESSNSSAEPQEMSFEKSVESLLIQPALADQVVKFELLSESPIEIKGKKEDLFTIFELPFKLSINNEYDKSVRKILELLEDDSGSELSSYIFDISQGKESIRDIVSANQEKLDILNKKLQSLDQNKKLLLQLKEQDGLKLASVFQSTSYYGDNIEEGHYKIYISSPNTHSKTADLFSNHQFYPTLKNNRLEFFIGSVEGKFKFSLNKDVAKKLKDGGEIKVIFKTTEKSK